MENEKIQKNDKNRIPPCKFEGKNLFAVDIPDGILSIDYRAYRNNKIKSLFIPDTVKSIGFEAFAGNIIDDLKLSEGIEDIGHGAFSDNKIKLLDLPYSLKHITQISFQRNKITNLFIPPTVREIDTGAFCGNKITKISIGYHVNIIDGEYDWLSHEGNPNGTFGDYSWGFLELYKSNGRIGGEYTYRKKLRKWKFKQVPLATTSSQKAWSEETRQYTKRILQNCEFGWNSSTGNISLKREDGTFGYIKLNDAMNRRYVVHGDNEKIEDFATVCDLTEAGWVLD